MSRETGLIQPAAGSATDPRQDRADIGLTPYLVAVAAILAAAIGVRLLNLFGGRGLWLDELYLAQNIFDRDLGGLLSPLDYEQIAPLGLMLLSEMATWLPGAPEVTLRVFPFAVEVAGLLCLPFMARAAGLSRLGAAITVALAAFLPTVARHGPEFKQYGIEFAFCVAVTLLALRLFEKPTAGRRAALWATGLACGMLSMVAPILLAPAGIAVFLGDLSARRWRALAATAVMGVSWLGVFGLSLWTVRSAETQAAMTGTFWDWAFFPIGAPVYAIEWTIRRAFDVFSATGGFQEAAGLALFFCLAGAAALACRRGWLALGLMLGPIAFALLGAVAQVFPFHGRLLHFTLPGVLALTAFGVTVVGAALVAALAPPSGDRPLRACLAGVAIALLLLIPGARVTIDMALRTSPPFEREGIDQLLPRVLSARGEGEVLYLHTKAVAPALRYAEREGVDLAPVVIGHDPEASAAHYLADLEGLMAHERVWLLFGGGWQGARIERAVWTAEVTLGQHGREVERLRHVNSQAVLFDFSEAKRAGTAAPRLITRPLPPYRPKQTGDFPDRARD